MVQPSSDVAPDVIHSANAIESQAQIYTYADHGVGRCQWPLAELQISIHLRASLLLVLYIQKELQTFPTQRHNLPRHLLNSLPLKKFVCTFTIVDDARCLRRPARIRIVLLEQRLP